MRQYGREIIGMLALESVYSATALYRLDHRHVPQAFRIAPQRVAVQDDEVRPTALAYRPDPGFAVLPGGIHGVGPEGVHDADTLVLHADFPALGQSVLGAENGVHRPLL